MIINPPKFINPALLTNHNYHNTIMYCHAKMIALMGIVFSSFFVVEFSGSQCEAVTIVVMSVIFVKVMQILLSFSITSKLNPNCNSRSKASS